jgi:hypothetical protein
VPEKAGRLRTLESESVLSENYGVPQPANKIKFPVKNLEKVLCLVMPKKRPEDRMKFLRRLMHDNLWVKCGRKPTDEEVAVDMALIRAKQFDQRTFAFYRGWILEYLPRIEADNLRNRAKAGAAARWKKKKTSEP